MIDSTPQPLCSRGKEHRYPPNTRLGGPQEPMWTILEKKKSLAPCRYSNSGPPNPWSIHYTGYIQCPKATKNSPIKAANQGAKVARGTVLNSALHRTGLAHNASQACPYIYAPTSSLVRNRNSYEATSDLEKVIFLSSYQNTKYWTPFYKDAVHIV